MRKKFYLSLIAFVTVFALLASAWTLPGLMTSIAKADAATETTTDEHDHFAKQTDPAALVATVNGEQVLAGTVNELYDYMADMYTYYGYDMTDVEMQASLYDYAVQSSIETVIMRQKATELGFTVTDEEKAAAQTTYDAEVEAYVQNILAGNEAPTDEDKANAQAQALDAANAQGYTVDVLIENTLLNKVQNEMTKDVSVSDDDVKQYYESLVEADKELYQNDYANYEFMMQYASYMGQSAPIYVPAGVRGVKHILLDVPEELKTAYQNANAVLEESLDETETTEADATEATPTPEVAESAEENLQSLEDIKAEMIANVQATVDEIKGKLESGTSFDELVVEYGTDPGMQSEPYKTEGYRIHLDSQGYDKAFKDASFAQLEKVGDVSEPVAGSYGVHILYYAGDIPEGAPELTAEMIASYKATLLSEKQSEAFTAKMNEWKAAATIEYATGE